MGVASTLFTAAQTLVTSPSAAEESSSSSLYASLRRADDLEMQARKKDAEAAAVVGLGRLEMAENAMNTRLEIAAQRAGFAASGVRVDSGSTLDMAADTAAWGEYERQKIEYRADMDSWGLRYDAALLRRDAGEYRSATATTKQSRGASPMESVGKYLFDTLGEGVFNA